MPHPRDSADLVGHSDAEQALLEAYRSGRLPHAWLIGGPRGVGKATLAWRFARFLLAYPDPASPDVRHAATLAVPPEHRIWARVRSGAVTDVALLRREWNDKTKKLFAEIRVDDVRSALGMFQRAAGAGGHRVCIIDSADDLNRSSANALLKVIEEPPPRSVFLILAHQPAQVLPTILSRCRKLMLGALDEGSVERVLAGLQTEEPLPPPAERAGALARSGGSVGRALRLLDPARLSLDRDLHAELGRLPAVDWRGVHRLADRLGSGDGGEAADLAIETVLDWVDGRVRTLAGQGCAVQRLAPLAEVWNKIMASAREAGALNLDRRPLLLSVFSDLAHAVRLADTP